MEAVLRALAEPRQRRIVQLVRWEELSAGDIAAHFRDVSRPAISQHVTILREAGLVTERRQGNKRLYRARPEALADVRAYIEQFWTDHLARLKAAAEEEDRDDRSRRNP